MTPNNPSPRVAPECTAPASAGEGFPFLRAGGGKPMNETQKAALAYIRRGWWVLPIQPGTKKPLAVLVPNGVHGATNDPDVAIDWWGRYPDAGIGIAVKPSGLVCIDIDPRNGGFETMQRLEAEHGPLVSDIYAFTGGGGQHLVCSSQQVENLPGTLGKGVDLKSDGYFCAYPTIHPNGVRYEWEASSDPIECVDAVPSMLPGWVRDLSRPSVAASSAWAQAVSSQRAEQRFATITPEQQAEIGEALAAIPSDEREVWLQVGMALQSTGDAQWAFDAWCEWSAQSDKFNAQDQIRVWRSFAARGLDGLTYRSIFELAKQHGTVVRPVPTMEQAVPVQEVRVAPAPSKQEVPAVLLAPPGIMGVVTDWVNATARKPQPSFAVQTAIAFVSTVLGRRFVTDQRNWSSLYLLNIGHSASGKEHAKKAAEDLLDACGLGHLIGPASYTSSSGLISALLAQPSHITVIDEFGKELEQASIKNNARAQGTMKQLIETWGRCDGVVRPQGYSTFGMSAADKQGISDRVVRNPALTLLGMTTPESFFETIGSAAARDGFLNRFLIVESDIGPQTSRMVKSLDVPEEVIAWAQAMAGTTDSLIDPASAASANLQPSPVEVFLSSAAVELFTRFEAECIELMKQNASTGLMEMFGRTNEIAMRLAMAVACGCHMATPMTVQGPHAAWAIQYVRFHTLRVVERLKTSVADSVFEAAKKQVINLLRKHPDRGMTVPEINRASLRFRSMTQRQQIELLNSLVFVGQAAMVEFPPPSGRGKKRVAWVAIDESAINVDENSVFPPDGVSE